MQQPLAVGGLVCALVFGVVGSVAGQEPTGAPERLPVAHDSTEAGRAAGVAAARRHGVGGYFTAAFFSGLPIGAAAPIAFGEPHPDVPPTLVTAAGVAGLIGTSIHANNASTALQASDEIQLREHDPEYQRAFRESFAQEIRRRRATLWGGITGTAVGVGAFLLLLTHIKT